MTGSRLSHLILPFLIYVVTGCAISAIDSESFDDNDPARFESSAEQEYKASRFDVVTYTFSVAISGGEVIQSYIGNEPQPNTLTVGVVDYDRWDGVDDESDGCYMHIELSPDETTKHDLTDADLETLWGAWLLSPSAPYTTSGACSEIGSDTVAYAILSAFARGSNGVGIGRLTSGLETAGSQGHPTWAEVEEQLCTGWFVTTAFQLQEDESSESTAADYFARNIMRAYSLSDDNQVMYDEGSLINFDTAGVLPDAYYTNYWAVYGVSF